MIKKNKKNIGYGNRRYIFECLAYRKPILKNGRGSWLKDVGGKKYLDLMSGQFSLPLGHGDEKFSAMLAKQSRKILHTNTMYLTEEVIDGAAALVSITAKGLNKVIFLSTGAEAIEFSIRHAKVYTGRDAVASLNKGYHGLTLATQSLTGGGIYARPLVPKSYSLPTPDPLDCPPGKSMEEFVRICLDESRKILRQANGDLAAIIVEPVISVGGMIYPSKEYFRGLKKIAEEHGALFIFDECQTGLGRTGKWFGYEYCGVVPDILVLAKGMGMGLPVSAVVMKNKVAKFLEGKIQHFSSHQNDPFAGMTTKFLIEFIKKNNQLDRINDTGAYLLKNLKKLSDKYPAILENPRGLGLMIGFNLSSNIFTKDRNPGQELISMLEKKGILIQAVKRGAVFRILPAYTISRKDLDFFVLTLDKCLGKLLKLKIQLWK